MLNYIQKNSDFSVLKNIWKSKPEVLVAIFSELYNSNDEGDFSMSTLLNIIQSIDNSLPMFLNSKNYDFALNLAVSAVRNNQIDLEAWITDKARNVGNQFTTVLIEYLVNSVFEPCRVADGKFEEVLDKAQLSLQSLTKILQILLVQDTNHSISHKNKSAASELYKELSNYFPEVSTRDSTEGPDLIASSMIEKVIEEIMPVNELIDLLIQYKNAESDKQRDVAMCVISILLDESRFFSGYKHKILMLMAQLYGAIMKNDIIEGKTRDLAFLIILDTVRQKESKKLYEFGVNAILLFKERLLEWPQKVAQIFQIDNMKILSIDILDQLYYVSNIFFTYFLISI